MIIEIWSDYVCPFCYIGKRKLEKALEKYTGDYEIVYKAYQLDPNAKTEAQLSTNDVLAKKYNLTLEKVRQMNESVRQHALTVGLNYKFDGMHYPNTFNAHRLVSYAKTKGLDQALSERLFKAHFIEGLNIGLNETLLELASEIGLNDVEDVLNSNGYAEAVQTDIKEAREIQIQGVPFFVFNRKYAISGAQPLEVFENTIRKISSEQPKKSPFQTLGDQGDVCGDDGCER